MDADSSLKSIVEVSVVVSGGGHRRAGYIAGANRLADAAQGAARRLAVQLFRQGFDRSPAPVLVEFCTQLAANRLGLSRPRMAPDAVQAVARSSLATALAELGAAEVSSGCFQI